MTKLKKITEILPEQILIKEIEQKYPILYENPLNVVLVSEISRYDTEIAKIKNNLENLENSLLGKCEFSENMRELAKNILKNTVPKTWTSLHLCDNNILKLISEYKSRMKIFKDWAENGQPTIFWLPAFWNVQGFLNAIKLNFARNQGFAIEKIQFETKFNDNEDLMKKEGFVIGFRGIFLENASWDAIKSQLIDPIPKQRFIQMPIVFFLSKITFEKVMDKAKHGKK